MSELWLDNARDANKLFADLKIHDTMIYKMGDWRQSWTIFFWV